MMSKRSTSIVKWIFVISIVELIFWLGITVTTPNSYWEVYKKMNLINTLWITNIIHYLIILIFIYQFYKNYKKISVTDSTKKLMTSIIKTRKTVRYFVVYNILLWVFFLLAAGLYFYMNNDMLLLFLNENTSENKNSMDFVDPNFIKVFFITFFFIGLIMVLIIIGFYRIIYGILLKRLMKNYKELEKIEI